MPTDDKIKQIIFHEMKQKIDSITYRAREAALILEKIFRNQKEYSRLKIYLNDIDIYSKSLRNLFRILENGRIP